MKDVSLSSPSEDSSEEISEFVPRVFPEHKKSKPKKRTTKIRRKIFPQTKNLPPAFYKREEKVKQEARPNLISTFMKVFQDLDDS